jgi:hypothetical protein
MDAEHGPQRVEGTIVQEFGKKGLMNVGHRQAGQAGPVQHRSQVRGRSRDLTALAAANVYPVGRHGDADRSWCLDLKTGDHPGGQAALLAHNANQLFQVAAAVLQGHHGTVTAAESSDLRHRGGGVVGLGGEQDVIEPLAAPPLDIRPQGQLAGRCPVLAEKAGDPQSSCPQRLDVPLPEHKDDLVPGGSQQAPQRLPQGPGPIHQKMHSLTLSVKTFPGLIPRSPVMHLARARISLQPYAAGAG